MAAFTVSRIHKLIEGKGKIVYAPNNASRY
jgi:hypothetical protein